MDYYCATAKWHDGCDCNNMKDITQAHLLEEEGKLQEAVDSYLEIHEQSPEDEQVVMRLLINYRKLKQYRKELQLINEILKVREEAAMKERKQWISKHKKMARNSLLLAKSLGLMDRKGVPVYQDPFIQMMHKRKTVVAKKLKG
jgi:tetratricopeptide (TPR) repeat protein